MAFFFFSFNGEPGVEGMKINLFLNKNVKSAIFEEQNGKFLFKREDSINTLLCGLKERQMVEKKI